MSENEQRPRVRLALVTGLSGSGKSSVAKCFEDLGYYTVDNLPVPLLRLFLDDILTLAEGKDRIAVVTDARAPGFSKAFPLLMQGIDRTDIAPTLLFLEASDEALVRRFSETRRPHPLAREGSVIEGIRREREELAEVRGSADMVIDTSDWSIHQVRRHIYREFTDHPGEEPELVVSLVSFGFKYGIPHGTDLLFDVRFLPNPYFIPELKKATGLDVPVQEYLEGEEEFGELVQRLTDFLLFLLPRYRRENRSYLTVGIGCTGGRHRSVASIERLAALLDDQGWAVRVLHRDITN
ncbi:MAG: RNase adapter RapZ [Deltaproteobacteria bacterium]|nr:RNase adapter RapZ [Deltaproteobacteria bacterium]